MGACGSDTSAEGIDIPRLFRADNSPLIMGGWPERSVAVGEPRSTPLNMPTVIPPVTLASTFSVMNRPDERSVEADGALRSVDGAATKGVAGTCKDGGAPPTEANDKDAGASIEGDAIASLRAGIEFVGRAAVGAVTAAVPSEGSETSGDERDGVSVPRSDAEGAFKLVKDSEGTTNIVGIVVYSDGV